MANDRRLSRRKALVVGGAASLGVLGMVPARALASKYERLDRALVEMRECKKYLQNAPDIFGGHKKRAVEALTNGIEAIEKAIKFAEK